MLTYPSRTAADLPGLAYVLEGETAEDRGARLAALIGPEIMGAVFRLAVGEDAARIAPSLARANLAPGLKAVLALFEADASTYRNSNDVASALGISQSMASTALTGLAQVGLLRLEGESGRLRYFGLAPEIAVELAAPGHEFCSFCGKQFKFGTLSGVCEVCIEDRV